MAYSPAIFPQLGAFPGEVGSSNSAGGINNSAMFPMNLPLNYYWNFSTKNKKSHKKYKKSHKKYKKSHKKYKKSHKKY